VLVERCEVCCTPLPPQRSGRPRVYCSNKCRQKASRSRHIIAALVEIDRINKALAPTVNIDWSDEEHRVT